MKVLRENKYIKGAALFFLFCYPFILLYTLELLNVSIGSETSSYFNVSAYSELFNHAPVFILYILIFYLILFMLFALTNHIFISGMVPSILLYAFYLANYYRRSISGWVLTPADFSFASNFGKVLQLFDIWIDKNIMISALLLILSLVILFFCGIALKKTIGMEVRYIVFSFSLLTLSLFLFIPSFQSLVFKFIHMDYSIYKSSQNLIYKENGVLLGFYILSQEVDSMEIFADSIIEIEVTAENQEKKEIDEFQELGIIGGIHFEDEYSKEYMESLVRDVKQNVKPPANHNVDIEKPNVIVIMSEAFWDPTRFENITFSDDPIPNFRKLAETSTSGNIITPAFGGSTCNPEFEFLTGNAMYFAHLGDTPYEMYESYIPEQDTRSIPQQFKNNGYRTVGVHTYQNGFFNRADIYPRLGFDEFIAEDQMEDAPIKGKYISDEYFTDRMINEIENTEEPLFLYGISMQNHFEFYPDKFTDIELYSSSDKLTEYQQKSVDAYIQGIHDADKQLGRLVEYLKENNKPTIVFFFGDHLPIVGTSFEIYEPLGYISTPDEGYWDLNDMKKIYTTPYVMWSNFELPEHHMEDLSPYFIGPMLLDLAGLDKNVYTSFLFDMYQVFHGMRKGLYKNENGTYFESPIYQDKEWIEKFYAFQYDYVKGIKGTGKHYGLAGESEMIKRDAE